MDVFKNKWFNRWAVSEHITDAELYNAAQEIAVGNVEADLGGYLYSRKGCNVREEEKAEDTGLLLDIVRQI